MYVGSSDVEMAVCDVMCCDVLCCVVLWLENSNALTPSLLWSVVLDGALHHLTRA
jgi:hypothetical protein